MDYIVMHGEELGEIERKVTEKGAEGYIPQGGLGRDHGLYFQAMVRVSVDQAARMLEEALAQLDRSSARHVNRWRG